MLLAKCPCVLTVYSFHHSYGGLWERLFKNRGKGQECIFIFTLVWMNQQLQLALLIGQ